MNRPRVLIADDHRILSEGLRGLLEPEFEVVGVVGDGLELLSAAMRDQPDVIVTDISMPSLNGTDAVAQLRTAGVSAKVVFLTMHCDVTYARRALAAGGAAFVLKHAAPAELLTAVREALQGRTYVTPLIAGELLQSYRDEAAPPRLTTRQQEVLRLVAEGRSAKEVAGALKISVRTAEAHKAHIMESLGLRTTADLVHYAIRNNIIVS